MRPFPKFQISHEGWWKLKYAPLWGVLLGLLMFVLVWFTDPRNMVSALAYGVLFGLLLARYLLKRYRSFAARAERHGLVLEPDQIKFLDGRPISTHSYRSISRLYVNARSGRVISLVLQFDDGDRFRLPNYDGLNTLRDELEARVGSEKVVVRKWFHADGHELVPVDQER